EQIESLHELGFIKRRENVILLGPPGVRKTHLAISLAIAAAQSGRRVYYGTFVSLIESAKACILLRRRHGGRRRAGRRTQASVPHLEPNGIPPPEHIVEILVRADPRPAERRPAGNERRILVEHVRDVRERLPLAAPSELPSIACAQIHVEDRLDGVVIDVDALDVVDVRYAAVDPTSLQEQRERPVAVGEVAGPLPLGYARAGSELPDEIPLRCAGIGRGVFIELARDEAQAESLRTLPEEIDVARVGDLEVDAADVALVDVRE